MNGSCVVQRIEASEGLCFCLIIKERDHEKRVKTKMQYLSFPDFKTRNHLNCGIGRCIQCSGRV